MKKIKALLIVIFVLILSCNLVFAAAPSYSRISDGISWVKGFFGIGTDDPTVALDVNGSVNISDTLYSKKINIPLNDSSLSWYPLDINSYNDYGISSATNGVVRFLGNGNLGYNKITFLPEGESEGEKIIFQVHKNNWIDNSTHKHASIYTTNTTGNFVKRWNLDYDVDIADFDLENVKIDINPSSSLWVGFTKFVEQGVPNNALLRASPSPNITNGNASFDLFRETNTTGTKYFRVYKGDNTATVSFLVNAENGNTEIKGNLDLNNKNITNLLSINDNLIVSGDGISLDLGSGANVNSYIQFNDRGYVGYDNVGYTVLQATSGKGLSFNVNNNTFANGQKMRILSTGEIRMNNLSGSYISGSAYVCVDNDGDLFTSEAACP